MSTNAGDEIDLHMRALELTCRSDKLRREMLWLSAMEKQDEATARELERIDPQLRSRMAGVEALAAGLEPRAASELYGAAQDERMETVLAIVERQARQNPVG